MTPLGHEDQSPRPRRSARIRFDEATFARAQGNGRGDRSRSQEFAAELTLIIEHEERLPPPRLSGCCRFSLRTFAKAQGNGRNAPIADRGGLERGRQQSTDCVEKVPEENS
jgi:hypothetical protein